MTAAADTDQLSALDRLLSPQLGSSRQQKQHECNCVEQVKSLLREFVDELRTVYRLPLPSGQQGHPLEEETDESTMLVVDRQPGEEPGGTTVYSPSSLPIVEDNDEEISHPDITCDSCQQALRGVRYKCNLCPMFNVCGNCEREQAAATRHGGELKHTFTEIANPTPAANPPPPIAAPPIAAPKPPPCVKAPVEQQESISSMISRVLIQTSSNSPEPPNLWSGAEDLPIAISPRVVRYESSATTVASSSQQHTPPEKGSFYDLTKSYDEICTKCGFGLSGGRFKCTSCPSFRPSEVNHPQHSFYTTSKEDYPTSRDQHRASCNFCHQTIFGARYKCLHPVCTSADVNLCAACESDSGGAHPLDHPLLKLRTPDSWHPVLRPGNPSVAGSEESRGAGVRRARGSFTPNSISSEGAQSLKSLPGYGGSSWLGYGLHEAGLGLRPYDAAF